jgi:site-specific DNA-cytosine methylase
MTTNIKWANIVPLIGGSAIGCEQATGTEPVYNMSYGAFAKNESHYHRYRPNVPNYVLDSTDAKESNVPSIKETGRLDFVNSVCPCAGLSMLTTTKPGANNKQRQAANNWMRLSTEYVLENLKPRVFWGENAPTMFTNSGKYMRDELIEYAQQHGYSMTFYKTSTAFHGIPQRRDRTFYFFWETETAPVLSWYNRPKKTFKEYITEMPQGLPSSDERPISRTLQDFPIYSFFREHLGLDHESMIDKLSTLPKKRPNMMHICEKGGLWDDYQLWLENNDLTEHRAYKELLRIRAKKAAGKNYMTMAPYVWGSETNAMVGHQLKASMHPTEPRFLNTREVMHMMGLPHDFEFTKANQFTAPNMLAQNVPTVTARDMAAEVVKFLNGELEDSGHTVSMQDNWKQKSWGYTKD